MLGTVGFGAVDLPIQGVLAIAIVFIVLLWSLTALRSGELCFSGSAIQLPLIGFVLIGIFQLLPIGDPGVPPDLILQTPSTSLSVEPYATRLFVLRMAFYAFFFAATLSFFRLPERIRIAAVSLIAFGAFMAVFGILQRLAEPGGIYGLRPTPQAIPFASFVNQHHFASLMVMLSSLSLGLLLLGNVKRDRIPLLLIAQITMLLAILFTGSRGAMIAYCGMSALIIMFWLIGRRQASAPSAGSNISRLSAISGVTALATIIIGLALYLGAGDGLLRGVGVSTIADSDITSGRAHFWKTGLKIFADHPIVGTGMDTFASAYPRYDTENGFFRVEHAHNDYLQVLTDSGIVGLACVAAFIFLLFRSAFRSVSNCQEPLRVSLAVGALGGAFGCLIHSFFDFPLRTPSNGFVFLLLVAFAVNAASVQVNEQSR